MGAVHTVIGAIALAVGGGIVWGLFFVLELLVKSMGANVMQYVLAAPLVLFISYLLGGAIHENRKGHRKA